ncbi:hypothetical protein [Microbacterium sp. KNMS]
MRIQVDLDPKDVWRIQEEAEERNIPPGAVLREHLETARFARRRTISRIELRALWQVGLCDAEIADRLHTTNGTIGQIRRSMGLIANPHPERGKRRAA